MPLRATCPPMQGQEPQPECSSEASPALENHTGGHNQPSLNTLELPRLWEFSKTPEGVPAPSPSEPPHASSKLFQLAAC